MLQPGQIFAGRYCISNLIGAGGMAEVYEAKHTLTEHAVALKLLRPHGQSASAGRANFALEARIDARVGSPHIVRVQDAGIDDATGAPYLVLELLRGKTLARLIQDQEAGRLRVDQTLDVLGQVALGLDAAHAFAVVHRDLKPENVFVTERSMVKILDFGIAKILDASDQVTQELRGTPYYMAAEQANGERVSAQTDVWALGLLAYRAFTGRIYWRCANVPGSQPPPLAKVVYEITVARRDPPSARLREQGVPLTLPDGFDAWFLRCIEVEASRRFASAGAAVAELRLVFDGCDPGVLPLDLEHTAPVPAVPEFATRPTRTYGELARPAAAAAEGSAPRVARALRQPLFIAALAVLLLGAVGGYRWQRSPERAAQRSPVAVEVPAPALALLPAAEREAAPAAAPPADLAPPAFVQPATAKGLVRRTLEPRSAVARPSALGAPLREVRSAEPAPPAGAESAALNVYALTPLQIARPGTPRAAPRAAEPAAAGAPAAPGGALDEPRGTVGTTQHLEAQPGAHASQQP